MRLARILGGRAEPAMGVTTQQFEAQVFARFMTTLRANWALIALLVGAAFLNLWHLTDNGYGNSYYAAAVRSMTQSWHNFFFASFDPGGLITVDKPPVALWMQAASAKLLGFSGFSILLPEALAGVGSVFVLYLAVSRVFGRTAGLIAGLVLAITPITVAINRSNNLDAWLIFFTVCAAYAVVRACENGSWRWLALSTLLIGVAFNTKTLAGFVALPPLMFAYAVCAPVSLKRRVRDLAIAGVVLVAVSGAWVAAVDLTPASSRPYVGGSQENSELDLLLNYNGLGRIDGEEQGFGGGARPANGLPSGAFPQDSAAIPNDGFDLPNVTTLPGGALPNDGTTPSGLPPFAGTSGARGGPGGGGPGGGPGGGGFGGGQTGMLRLFNHEISAQASWLIPLALIGGLGALLAVPRRLSGNPRLASIIVWGGWLLTAGVVFSNASGIFHPYYLSYLGPAIGGMVGITAAGFWTAARDRSRLAFIAPLALASTAAFEISILNLTPDYKPWLVPAVAVTVALGAIVLLAGIVRRIPARWAGAGLALALGGLLLPPLVWSSSILDSAGNGTLPFVSPASAMAAFGRGGGPGETQANQGLIDYLQANRSGAKYLVATESSMSASGIIIATGEPVMAIGGFSGGDPALTLSQFASLVESGTVRYFLVGGGGPGGFGGGTDGAGNQRPDGGQQLRDGPEGTRPNIDGAQDGLPEIPSGAELPAGGPGGRGGTRAISQAVTSVGKLVDASAYGGSGGQLYDLQGTANALRALATAGGHQ